MEFQQTAWDPRAIDGSVRQLDTASPDEHGCEATEFVHEGFEAMVLTACQEVQKWCRGAEKVTLVGHSLGGASAMLTADALMAQGEVASITLVTAGCPAVGNAAFASRWESHVSPRLRQELHLVHGEDVVPRLPPKGILPGYEHTAPGHWLIQDDGSSPQRLTPDSLDSTLLEDLDDIMLSTGIVDHYIQRYEEALGARFQCLDVGKASTAVNLLQVTTAYETVAAPAYTTAMAAPAYTTAMAAPAYTTGTAYSTGLVGGTTAMAAPGYTTGLVGGTSSLATGYTGANIL